MGNLNLSQYQAAVLRAAGNIRASVPAVLAGDHTRSINWAANQLIREYPEHFIEHLDNSWTLGPTEVGKNKIALADNVLIIDAVRTSDDATIDTTDSDTLAASWASTPEKILYPTSIERIGILNKAATTTGYPRRWARYGKALMYNPTTRTGYTTYLHIHGMAGEIPLTAAGNTFRLHYDYDEAVITKAAARFARIIGQKERADELEADVKRMMQEGVNIVARERVTKGGMVTSGLCPR